MITNHGFTITQLVNYRASATSAIRRNFEQRGAVETRTPVLSTCPDLAPVRQFVCQHPYSSATYCLRIAPEEHLTRLIGLGVPAVYEIATNFRCETVDASHLIEFESIEALFSGTSLTEMMDLMEAACRAVADAGTSATGKTGWKLPNATFPRIQVPDWVKSELGMSPHLLTSHAGLRQIATRIDCGKEPTQSMVQLMDDIIGSIAGRIGGPVFVGIFPAFLGGPAAREPVRSDFISRYELYYNGLELGSAAQQLRDANDWRARYEYNIQLKRDRGIEPNFLNQELLMDISALPEFAGLGLGFERMLALGLGLDDIRHVRLFDN